MLLIQCRVKPERALREEEEFRVALNGAAVLDCISALETRHMWSNPKEILSGYDAVMIGGSGDFHLHGGVDEDDDARRIGQEILERLRPLVLHCVKEDIPLFGICFGHQLIAEVLGGSVTHDHSQKKTGTYTVNLNDAARQDPLFKDFPNSFAAQYAHKDSVTELPRGATLLMTSPQCRFSALRYGTHVYSVQFHPESTCESMVKMGHQMPQYLPEGKAPEDIFSDSPVASTLIQKFVQMVA